MINLDKDGHVSFAQADSGLIEVTATWSSPFDVDLVALYDLNDPFVKEENRKSAVQALDTCGNLGKAPYILFGGDSRSGGSERLTINLPRAYNLQRVLIFAYIYGPGTWKDVKDAEVVVHHPTEREDHVFKLQGATRQELRARRPAYRWQRWPDAYLARKILRQHPPRDRRLLRVRYQLGGP